MYQVTSSRCPHINLHFFSSENLLTKQRKARLYAINSKTLLSRSAQSEDRKYQVTSLVSTHQLPKFSFSKSFGTTKKDKVV